MKGLAKTKFSKVVATLGAAVALTMLHARAETSFARCERAWFTACEGSWTQDGAWTTGGAALTPTGARFALGGETAEFAPSASAPTTGGVVRVEVSAEILAATDEASLPTDDAAQGRLALVKPTEATQAVAWRAFTGGAWRVLTGGETQFGAYTLRMELDYSCQPGLVRYSVARGEGEFAVLNLNGAEWLTNATATAEALAGVSLCGDAEIVSLTGRTSDALVADAFVAVHVANAETKTADDVWTALTTPRTEGNEMTLLESYVLGLDPDEKGARPTVQAARSTVTGKTLLSVGNIAPRAGTGVKVAYSLSASSSPNFATVETTAEQAQPTFEVAAPSTDAAPVRYYRINVLVGDGKQN